MAEQEKKRDMGCVRDMMLKHIQLERGQIGYRWRLVVASDISQLAEETKREI